MREDEDGPRMTNHNRVWLAGFLLVVALIAVMFTCGSCARPRPMGLSTLYPPAVARLDVPGCTVWKLDDELLATAGHCCEEGRELPMSGPTVPIGDLEPAKLLVDDDVHDVCIIRGKLSGPGIELADDDPKVGQPVWTAGYPMGIYLISSGFWSGRITTREDSFGMCSVVVAGGASGSPILDRDGRAVGVLVRRTVGMDNQTWVAPIEWLRRAYLLAKYSRGEFVHIAPAPSPVPGFADLEKILKEWETLLPPPTE